MSLSQGSATFCFLFWLYFSCGFSAVAFSLNFSLYVVGSPLARPLGRLGPLPHSLVGLVLSNQETTSNLVQIPWNFVEGLCISGNPNKGNSVIRCYQQTRPNGTRVVSSYSTNIRRLVPRPLFRSRARVALGSELRLLMSFSWPVFSGLDQDLFPPTVFLVFWDSIPKQCKGVHCVDLVESFPKTVYLQNLASIQPRTSPNKFVSSSSREFESKL